VVCYFPQHVGKIFSLPLQCEVTLDLNTIEDYNVLFFGFKGLDVK